MKVVKVKSWKELAVKRLWNNLVEKTKAHREL
jgi:hypothetical protein